MLANIAKSVSRRNAFGSSALIKSNVAVGTQQRLFATGFSIDTMSRDKIDYRLNRFKGELVQMNWGDPLVCQHNYPFLQAEFEKLDSVMAPYVNDNDMGAKWSYCVEAWDAFHACTDAHDFILDILELKSRSKGIFNSGFDFFSQPVLENEEEVYENIVDNYEKLKTEYKNFVPKVEQTAGHGLAMLRMNDKRVDFSSKYRFFY